VGRPRDAQVDVRSGHNCDADIFFLGRNSHGMNPTFLMVRSVISLIEGGVEGGVGLLG
jgi:hypothetical protein